MSLILGTNLGNLLNGTSADDLIAGLGGNDTLNGGLGTDTAWYSGNLAGYTFASVGGRLVVRDINPADGSDGTDSLSQVESLQFGNSQLSLTSAEFRANAVTFSDQNEPTITALADGGFVIAWQSWQQDGEETGIFAQRYDARGLATGPEFQVNTIASSRQSLPTVGALADGGFVVCWETLGRDGDGYGIYGQRFDSDGHPLEQEFRINTTGGFDQVSPSIAALSDGGFVVSWESSIQDGSGYASTPNDSTPAGSSRGRSSASTRQ
ncbi:MAG: hypothetical protein ABI699_11950 [Caldimonas sp.]